MGGAGQGGVDVLVWTEGEENDTEVKGGEGKMGDERRERGRMREMVKKEGV